MTPNHQDRSDAAGWLPNYAAGLWASAMFAGPTESVVTAVQLDPNLTPQQREALQELYSAFRETTREHRRINN